MREALAPKVAPIKLAGRTITHLQFADDVDLLDGSRVDQQSQINSLDSTSRRYGMEISLEKTKCLVSGPSDTNGQVTVRGTELEQVSEFTYLGSVQTEDCSSDKERINAFEMNCYRRLLRVHWTSHTTNKEVMERIHTSVQGPLDSFLATVKKEKLQWFGHVSRAKGTLSHTVLQGKVEGARPRGRPRRSWITDLKEWTGVTANQMARLAEDRQQWKNLAKHHAAPTAD
ncbi:hypothetical protein Bbelb_313240 [Branchiostoma belcheri]|nr:hypothetical protein Bbelb_313240 [Branchiostoma belcheri]